MRVLNQVQVGAEAEPGGEERGGARQNQLLGRVHDRGSLDRSNKQCCSVWF